MEEKRTRYPHFNLLDAQEEWDPHTREIVLGRLGPFGKPKFLTGREAELVKVLAKHLIYDQREEILDYIAHHFDNRLDSQVGEDQRPPDVPKEADLVRLGLTAISKLARLNHKREFPDLNPVEQFNLITALQNGKAPALPDWERVAQKELFKKLLELTVSAYFSHPTVWSEIGYGGPAYPRGYIRTELGLADPWEAKLDE